MTDQKDGENNDAKVENKEALVEKEKGGKIEKSIEEIRREKWEKITNEIEHTADRLGCPIDKGIRKTVIALNVFGINTAQSCEGHSGKHGAGTPWIDIEATNEPEECYNNQKKILARVAEENNITMEELDDKEEYQEIMIEAWQECVDNGKTKETIAWQEENNKLRIMLESVLDEFYANKDVSEYIKIRLLKDGGWGRFRIISGAEEDYYRESKNENGKNKLKERIKTYRKEMDGFAKFLKGKFFAEGESYMDEKRKLAQEKIDKEKLENVRKGINEKRFVNWNEFWETEGLKSPSRKDVFPNGEDAKMSDEKIVEALNNYFDKKVSNLFNMTGINSEEFPEVIDQDIRDLCVRLNKLPFLKTREGCEGHEFYHSNGEINDRGYSEPYLTLYINMEYPGARVFVRNLGKELDVFRKSNIPGIENVTFNFFDEPTETVGVNLVVFRMRIVPTEDWCKKNGKSYVERPKDLGSYEQWCKGNSCEYSQDEESDSWKKWEETKSLHKMQREKFEKEYSDYFRSEEVKKIRDAFFEVFSKASS